MLERLLGAVFIEGRVCVFCGDKLIAANSP